MAIASPVLVVAMFAFFTTWSLKASAGSAPSSACSVAVSEAGMLIGIQYN